MPPVALAYLGSHFLSLLGNGILAVALPLIVLQNTNSPLSVGAVSAATAVPAVVVGLCAGVVLDRVNRRTCSMLSDVVSAGAVAAIPLVDLLGELTMLWLIGLAVVGSFGDVPGMTARQVLIPAVARHTGVALERLVGLRQSATSLALVIGPAAAGTLISLFDGTTVLFVTAATSAAAALLTLALPNRLGQVDGARTSRESMWTQLLSGAVALRSSRFLTASVSLTIGLAVVIGGLQGLVLPLYFDSISRPDLLGFVLTALAVGMLSGTTVFAIVGARLPRRFAMPAALLGTTAGFALMATVASPPVVFAGAAVFGVSNAVLSSVLGVWQAENIADTVRGRVLSLQNACLQVAAPAGIGLAGVVAEHGSTTAAGIAVLTVWLAVATVLATSKALTPPVPQPVGSARRSSAVSGR